MSPNDKRPRRDCLHLVPGSRPPGVPAPDPVIGGSLRFEAASLDRPTIERQRIATLPERLTPAAHRLIATALGELRERLGDALLTSLPPLEAVPVGDDRASIALVLTFDVRAMNEYALDHERLVMQAAEALTDV